MKLLDIYYSVKEEYLDAIILIKSGNFYVTYNNDALILHYILNYKKIGEKVGFPLNALETVTSKLEEKEINYVIYNERENIRNSNNYYRFLQDANNSLIVDNMCTNLTNKIKTKVMENLDNYNKIKDFIDEL